MKLTHLVGILTLALTIFGEAYPAGIALYSSNTNHIWNRLYAGLIVRTTPNGMVQDDLLDPPFWPKTRHLLAGESNHRALILLREFTRDLAGLDKMSALQRAVMQRDLLAIFQWLAGHELAVFTPEQRELLQSLARAMRAVALTEAEIHTLPDNYAVTVALPGTPTAPDPGQMGRAFLPKDLLADAGDWIALEPQGDDWLAASVHFNSFSGRSAFEVRFRHAGGRAAGEKYLQQLAEMPDPFVLVKPEQVRALLPNSDPKHGPWPNLATPQFPTNTMWALVRRAVLVDVRGNPVVSPLVESVQIRLYRALSPDASRAQTFFEWEARRQLLLGEGGFHLTEAKDLQYAHFPFSADPFEQSRPPPNRLNCYECHSGLGIHSVASRSRLFEPQLARPPEFRVVNSARVAQITQIEAGKLPSWQLLRWLWNEK